MARLDAFAVDGNGGLKAAWVIDNGRWHGPVQIGAGAGNFPPGPEKRVAEEEWLKRALRGLEPQCRACLLLYVVSGFSQPEIATMLGILESAVSGNVCRGRTYLRHCKSFERKDL